MRFMAGRHTPTRVFDKGCAFYTKSSPNVKQKRSLLPSMPTAPRTRSSRSNTRLWSGGNRRCINHVHLLHLAWYGQDWAELNHGKEVLALRGYTFENWLKAHQRLIDIGLKYAGEGLAVELPFSGHGPCARRPHYWRIT